MAYGAMHGGGVSLFDLMALAADIESGIIGTPLAASNGLCLATRNGEALLACNSLCGDGSPFANELYAIQSNLIRGIAVAPLLTASGEQLCDRNCVALAAVKNL